MGVEHGAGRVARKFIPEVTKVLVVEDHPFFLDLVLDGLRGAGIVERHGTTNAAEALAAIPLIEPDIILTDWIMPGMDGLELCRVIRRTAPEPHRSVPIIMVSGNTRASALKSARDAGIDEFIGKPLVMAHLMARVRSSIENPRPFVVCDDYVGPCRRRKVDLSYDGPWRRATDTRSVDAKVSQLGTTAAHKAAHTSRTIATGVNRLAETVARARAGDLDAFHTIPDLVADIAASAAAAGDTPVTQACNALTRYVVSLPANELPRLDVLDTLVDGLNLLMTLEQQQKAERESVASGLEKVVAKTVLTNAAL